MTIPAYILWLPSSYPSKVEPYDGDFVQRHAQAASAFTPIHVLYFVRDREKRVTHSILVDEKQTGNLTETIVYYSTRNSSMTVIDRFLSLWNFRKLYKKTIADLFANKGLPSLTHVHIAFKAGIIATWIKKEYGVPFFLTEHSTMYLSEARPNLRDLNFLKRYLISKVIAKTSRIFCVSHYLGEAIRREWPSINYKVIPNVVDTSIFYPVAHRMDRTCRLIHISNLGYQKNPEMLFDAVRILKKSGLQFSLDIFGVRDMAVRSLASMKGVVDVVNFHQEIPQKNLAEHLRRSDLLILCSRYETFGCVVIEANACGVPAVVADIPVMHELIRGDMNGVFVKPESAAALAEAVINIRNTNKPFNQKEMVATASRYSYHSVGQMFFDEYTSFVNDDEGT